MYSHIELDIYLRVVIIRKQKDENYYRKIYSYIVSNWEEPISFYNNYNEEVKIEYQKEVILYFSALGIYRGIKVPKSILMKTTTEESKQVLKVLLKDYDLLKSTIDNKKRIGHGRHYIERLYYLVYMICSYYGKDRYKEITEDMILDDELKDLFVKEESPIYRLLDLMYFAGYNDVRAKDVIWKDKIKKRELEKKYIGNNLGNVINEYRDTINNSMGDTQVKQKISELNAFIEWIKERFELEAIDNFDMINRKDWLSYISFICDIDSHVNKTKNAKLLAIFQFLEWVSVIHPSMLNKDLFFSRDDFKKTYVFNDKVNDLAFKNSHDARKILNFLYSEYRPKNIYEQFYISAIILAANSGMRRSEISDLEYGNVRFCEETKLYIIEHNVVDKLSVKNRPIYITEVGYKEILKIMDIRRNNDILKERKPRKGGKPYIHLFEYRTSDVLYSPKFDYFMIKINNILNIEKRDDEVEAGLHGFRHFMAVEVFKESGYDISTVKYLLRHKTYQMSISYQAQEREKEIVKSREYLEDEVKFEGLGIDTIINILFSNGKYEDYILNKKILNASKTISELIKIQEIKKLSIGYCLKPCDKADRCFKCNNFLIERQEKDKLLSYAKELSELITFKIYILKQSFDDVYIENKLKNDIEDLMIIIKELEGLGVTKDEIDSIIKGGEGCENERS